jgi:hypothetical protein
LLSDEQCAEIVSWLGHHVDIAAETNEIVTTGKTLDYYIGCWGTPQETATLESGLEISVWRGEGYFFLIAECGEFRAAAVF